MYANHLGKKSTVEVEINLHSETEQLLSFAVKKLFASETKHSCLNVHREERLWQYREHFTGVKGIL